LVVTAPRPMRSNNSWKTETSAGDGGMPLDVREGQGAQGRGRARPARPFEDRSPIQVTDFLAHR
jgi:hypothetical protein